MANQPAAASPAEPPPATPAPALQPAGPRPLSGARQHWRFCIGFVVLSLAFLALEIWYQLQLDPIAGAIRGAGLSAVTFISFALLSSIIFKFHPAWAKYWYVRRSLGVMGFVFAGLHAPLAISIDYGGDARFAFSPANPFFATILLGAAGFTILFLLFISSNDWMVAKLGARWKTLHRLVYFAYISVVAHARRMGGFKPDPPHLLCYTALGLTLAG